MGKRGKRKKLKKKLQKKKQIDIRKAHKPDDDNGENKSNYLNYVFILLIILLFLKLLMVFDIFLSKPFTSLLHNSIYTNYYIAVTNSIIEILFTISIVLIITNRKHFLLTGIAIIISVIIFNGHDLRYISDYGNVSRSNYSTMKLVKDDFYVLQNNKATGIDTYYIQLNSNRHVLHMNSKQYHKLKNLSPDSEIEITYLENSRLLLDYEIVSED